MYIGPTSVIIPVLCLVKIIKFLENITENVGVGEGRTGLRGIKDR